MLFREQGIAMVSILIAIGMAVSVLVEALLPSGGVPTQGKGGGGGDGNPENVKEWLRNKLKALASLLRKSEAKQHKHCLASLQQSSAGSSTGQKR